MEGADNSEQKENKGKQKRNPSKDHVFRKRRPAKPERGNNVIYVSTKTPTKAVLERCNKLISKNETEIVIYCLGAAIQRGILSALRICEEHPSFKIHTNTFTTELIDDLEPAADDADYLIQRRFNSALRLRLLRADPLTF